MSLSGNGEHLCRVDLAEDKLLPTHEEAGQGKPRARTHAWERGMTDGTDGTAGKQAMKLDRGARKARRGRRAGAGTLLLLGWLCLHTQPAMADIWGYVDSDRMPHFAATRLDDRYELLLRDNVEPFQRVHVASNTPAASTDIPAPEPAQAVLALPGAAPAGVVSPKLRVFFEQSRNYKAVSPLLREASKTHGIDYSLLKALIAAESGFNPDAVSSKGAVGLMQLIPPTAERYGVSAGKNATVAKKLTDPRINIRAGTRYLADLIKMFPGQLELALAAYNAGEGAVQRAGNKIPNYPETRNYVKTVMQLYNGLTPAPIKTPAGRVRQEIRGSSTEAGQGNMAPVELVPTLSRAGFPQD